MASVSPLRIYLAVLGLAFLAGVLGSMAIEGLSPLDAVYFVIATLTTVGYGDITPKTAAGKVLAIFIIFAGIGTFAAAFASAIEILVGRSEARERQRKVNMIIGVFFSEFGTGMLATLARLDPEAGEIRRDLVVKDAWGAAEFQKVREKLLGYGYRIDGTRVDFEGMRGYLREKRPFLLALMENPVLFQDDGFTNLLQAVFHLADELLRRGDLSAIPPSDHAHLVTDTERVYRPLALQWLDSMEHLKEHHPYLFSLAMRTNPFDDEASVVVR
ncbi:MAG: potassium channel family protein [Methanomicrobiales archaeon]|nr:potassium channel family protein [Methanomicrobiales archaeon]